MKEERFIKSWSKIRKKNKSIYLLRWTIILFICTDIGNFVGRLMIDSWYLNTRRFIIDQIIGLIILLPSFYLISMYIYKVNEKKYNHLSNES